MKKRPAREISVFNLSMLDVIFSALGAVLILLIMLIEYNSRLETDLERTQQELERANNEIADMSRTIEEQTEKIEEIEEKIRQRNEELRQQKEENARTKEELKRNKELAEDLEEANKKLKKKIKKNRGRGAFMGQCRVPLNTRVTFVFFDHGGIDDDRVRISFNQSILFANLSLPGPPGKVAAQTITEDANYLYVKALSEGNDPPNTATVIIKPCINGAEESFKWELTTGQEAYLTIEGI